MTMDQQTFGRLRDIVYEESGISLSPAKRALLMARTAKRIRALGLAGYEDYLRALENDESGAELVEFLDAVSTNVTGFFREPEHFDLIRSFVDESLAAGRTRLRCWSAGCASGEEPFSLAMTVLDAAGDRSLDVRILATDINTHMLEVARRAEYGDEKARSIPVRLRHRYLERAGGRERRTWIVGEELRRIVLFRRLNLAGPPFPMSGPLDVVFCRNVMIYFDLVVRRQLLVEFSRLLRPGGLLVVGHAESLASRTGLFALRSPSVLVKG
jgi:chemotaxis protein methyltransferase CheR